VKELKEKYGIKPGAEVMEFIGFGQADLGIVLDAYRIVKQKRKKLIFIIVGPLEKRWERHVEALRHNEDIIITGKVPFSAVSDYAAIADVFMMPLSDNNANRGRGPIKAGDYMAAGRPLIANPVGDMKIWVKKYGIGELADYSGASMAKALEKLLSHKGLMKEYGKNARKTAEKVLSWGLAAEKLEKAYEIIKNMKKTG
jgi:glycosyltransferase involved in cell wall biosynthesis